MKFNTFLKEFLVVLLGVFLAMVMNSWNEDRKAKIEAERYLDGIKDEIKDNIKILEDAIPYHQDLLDGLRSDPTSVSLVLNVANVNNTAWRLAENNTFKSNIDKQLFYKLDKMYQLHDYLVSTQSEAERLMSESNIMSPYYELQLIGKDIQEEDIKELGARLMMGWIPIFESWTHAEKKYLAALEKTLSSL